MVADMKVYKVAGMVPDNKVDMMKKYTLLRDCS